MGERQVPGQMEMLNGENQPKPEFVNYPIATPKEDWEEEDPKDQLLYGGSGIKKSNQQINEERQFVREFGFSREYAREHAEELIQELEELSSVDKPEVTDEAELNRIARISLLENLFMELIKDIPNSDAVKKFMDLEKA